MCRSGQELLGIDTEDTQDILADAQYDPSWLNDDVLFMDADESDVDNVYIVGMTGPEVTSIKITSSDKCLSEVFSVLDITGDGGFSTYLFKASDYDKIIRVNPEIKFVTRE